VTPPFGGKTAFLAFSSAATTVRALELGGATDQHDRWHISGIA
jgi:hypothetical protein